MAAEGMALGMTGKQEIGAISFDQLMSVAERPVLRVCYRLLGNRQEAQDAAQEVFLKAYNRRAMFQTGREPMPWLYQVAVNECRDRLRKRRPTVELDHVHLQETSSDPEQQAEAAERKRMLLEALASLGERERTALVLRELEGLETREVALILDVAEETVRSQCSIAKAKLKHFLDQGSRK